MASFLGYDGPTPSNDFTNPWGIIGGGKERQGAADAAADQRQMSADQYAETRRTNDTLAQAESDYAGKMNTQRVNSRNAINMARNPYIDKLSSQQGLIGRDTQQSTDQYGRGKGVYDQLLSKGAADNKNAMSLADAMDPNNPVAQRYRDSQTQRMKDYGTMARGASVAASSAPPPNVAGMNPALLRAINTSRSGQAYANAQRSMNDMRNQNFMYGIANSNNAYNLGQQALTNSNQIAQGYQNQNNLYGQEQQNLRGENMGVGGNILNERANQIYGQAQDRADYINDSMQGNLNAGNRNLAAIGQRYGSDAASYLGYAQGAAGGSGGLLSGAGTLAGGGAAYATRQNPPQQQTVNQSPAQRNPVSGGYSKGPAGTPY